MSLDTTRLIIGDTPQYFFDSAIVEEMQNVRRRVCSPEKTSGPLIQKDRPWEKVPYFTCNTWNVVRDAQTGDFKCWYEDWHMHPGHPDFLDGKISMHSSVSPSRCCFARSNDGIHWEKPGLDYLEEDGQKTNVVFGSPEYGTIHAATILQDPTALGSAQHYKMLYAHLEPGEDDRIIRVAASPDGISWTPYSELPQFGKAGADLSDVFILNVDRESGVYYIMTRHAQQAWSPPLGQGRPSAGSFTGKIYPHDPMRMNRRRIFLCESADLVHWSYPQCVLKPNDREDNIDEVFYGMTHFTLGDYFVGLLNVFHHVDNTMDVRLVYSRDRVNWHFLNNRQPWLAPEYTQGAWDRYMVNIPSIPICVDDEWFVYYGGASNHHDWWIRGRREGLDVPEAKSLKHVGYGLGLAKLRKNGLVALEAGQARPGLILTRLLSTSGQQLDINARCGAQGPIQVEICDAHDNILEGFDRESCDPFTGDEVQHTVSWDGRTRLPQASTFRIRFYLSNAALFSFRTVGADDKNGASYEY